MARRPRRPRTGAADVDRRSPGSGRRAGCRARHPGPRSRRRRSTRSSTSSSPAATSTTRPAGCAVAARASTRSARQAMRPTPSWPAPCDRRTRRCCTTGRVASTSGGRRRCPVTTGSAMCCWGCSPRPTSRSPAAATRCSGTPRLAVIPQTSTIASHLPRAMGVAFAIGRARRLGLPTRWPTDAIAVCSFGDASLNHSTAQGALNAASYTAHQRVAMPLLLVCEDNGWGISVPSPGRVGRGRAGPAPRTALRAGRRRRPRRRVRHDRGARRARAGDRAAGGPAPPHRPLRRPRRHRRRDVLPRRRRHPRRPRPRPPARHGTRPRRRRVRVTGRPRRPVPRRPAAGARAGGRARRPAAAHRCRGGRRPAGAVPAGSRRGPCRPQRPVRGARRVLLREAARGRGSAHARRVDQPDARRPPVPRSASARLRRGRRGQGRRLRRHARAAEEGGPPARVRLTARRAIDPRPGARRRRVGPRADPRDPVPRLPAQRRGPAAGRGGEPALLLQRAVHEPARRAHRRVRLPAGLRRALPQRQRRGRPARHPRPRHRLPGPPR